MCYLLIAYTHFEDLKIIIPFGRETKNAGIDFQNWQTGKKTKKQTEAQSRNFNVKLVFTFGNVSLNSFLVCIYRYMYECSFFLDFQR